MPLWLAFALSRRSPTRAYTYGYHRAEDLAGIFILAMIVASAVVAGYESLTRLLDPQPVGHPWVVAAAGVIGFAGNELVAGYRIRVGRRIGSAALVADGQHARTDGFTSLAVVAGAVGVLLGFPLADPLIGLAHHDRDPRRAPLGGPRHLPAADGRRRPRARRRRRGGAAADPRRHRRGGAAAALDRAPAARRGRCPRRPRARACAPRTRSPTTPRTACAPASVGSTR